jgi:hypothetical protein
MLSTGKKENKMIKHDIYGSYRITIEKEDNIIRKNWMRVTIESFSKKTRYQLINNGEEIKSGKVNKNMIALAQEQMKKYI